MKTIGEYLRVIGVLTRKDIGQGIRNRNILVLFFSVAFLIVFYNGLPSLTAGSDPAPLYVYDAGGSGLGERLAKTSSFDVRADIESEEALRRRVAAYDLPALGLLIPADFEARRTTGEAPAVEGYAVYWMTADQTENLRRRAEEELTALLGTAVAIRTEGHTVYGKPDDDGAGTQASMALVFSLTMMGITLIPHLMFDEKKARTLDMLMVSPAGASQIAAGKALAGLFFSAFVIGLGAVANRGLILHWGWFAVILAFFGLFAVLIGLILGTVMENRAQFAVWSWVIILPLMMPVVLYLLRDLLPAGLAGLLQVIPTVTAVILMGSVYAEQAAIGALLPGLAWLAAWIVGELAIVAWLLRRRDRAEAPKPSVAPAAEMRRALPAEPARPAPPADAQPAPAAGLRASLRIVAAIAAKDVRDALRNRLILSVLVGTVILSLNSALLPALIDWRSLPVLVVYDEGASAALRELAGRPEARVASVGSRAEMEETVLQARGDSIGIVLPADFDERAMEGGGAQIEAYAAHWTDPAETARVAAFFEEEFRQYASAEVSLLPAAEALYPAADSGGQPMINLLTQFLMLVVVGFAVVPLLLVEEKESRTMDILRVSPAGWGEILAGKALAGAAYCLAVGLLIAALNARMIVHWEIAAAAFALGSVLVISIGLLIGTLADSPTTAAFWAGPLLLLIIVPALLEAFAAQAWPAWLAQIFSWMPTNLILRMFRLAIAGEAPAAEVWRSAAVLGATALALCVLAAWAVRRKAEG